jgi:hypothetical protein
MDALIDTAARALAAGDLIGVLNQVGLRSDAPALALRGIAMAQLGETVRARVLLRDAARRFGAHESTARARCIVAEAEIALVSRDLRWQPKALGTARVTLELQGDWINAAHARQLEIRRLLLIGQIDAAEAAFAALDPAPLPPALRASYELIAAGVAVRQVRATTAHAALRRAERAARQSRRPALIAEVARAQAVLESPAARVTSGGVERTVDLTEVEALLAPTTLVVDACRQVVRGDGPLIDFTRRPVMFLLVRALAEAWPRDVPRNALIHRAFRARRVDGSHRVRLRVQMARVRAALRSFANVTATPDGFALTLRRLRRAAVLAPLVDNQHAALLALLADGEAWSTAALSVALAAGPRTVQRALKSLAANGRVLSYGRGRARRWTAAPVLGFTTGLLLPGPLPIH